MTREEILNSKSFQLNLIIAIHIFGWIAWEERRGEYKYVVFQRPGGREPYKYRQNWEKDQDRYKLIQIDEINPYVHIIAGLPDYSTDISAAWEVVNKIQAMKELNGRKVRLQVKILVLWETHTVSIIDYLNNDKCLGEVMSNSAPEAIVKAALLSVMEGEDAK